MPSGLLCAVSVLDGKSARVQDIRPRQDVRRAEAETLRICMYVHIYAFKLCMAYTV